MTGIASDLEETLLSLIHSRFASLPSLQTIELPLEMKGLGEAFYPDLVAKAGNVLFLIELKNRLSTDDVARAFMYSRSRQGEQRSSGRLEYVLMAKAIPKGVRDLAQRVDVAVVSIPVDTQMPRSKRSEGHKVSKLSTDKSWRVVSCLLRRGPASVREISIESGVSYGWAHATVNRLLRMGIVTKTPDGVAVTDLERLLNGLAWERPLRSLWVTERRMDGDDVMRAGRTVSEYLSEVDIEHAFTAITSGGLYTGYAHRFDRLYIYIGHEEPDIALGPLENPHGSISVTVLRADRDVFGGTVEKDGMRIASEAQTLLDLAGMGASAWDMTLEVARHYVSTGGG